MSRRLVLVLVAVLVVGLVAGAANFGLLAWQSAADGGLSADGGDLVSPDGTAKVHVPAGGATGGTTVDFVMKPKLRGPGRVRGAIIIGTPVDIVVRTGRLSKGTVTLKYSADQIPKGVTDRQIGPVIFNPKLNAWIPLPGSKVDPASHTVSFPAPHFSLFGLAVLDPTQAIQKFGELTVNLAINATTSLYEWTTELVETVANKITRSVSAEPSQPLVCDPESPRFVSMPQSAFQDMFKSCVETSTSFAGENRLRMWNHYGFPLLMAPGKGFWQRIEDIGPDADLVQIARSLFWMMQGKVIVEGADVTSMRFYDQQQYRTVINGEAEWHAILFDAILAAAIVHAPKSSSIKAELTGAWKAASNSAAKSTASVAMGPTTTKAVKRGISKREALQWFETLTTAVQCLPTMKGVVLLTKQSFEAAADVTLDCIESELSALADMVGMIAAGLHGAGLLVATLAHSAAPKIFTKDASKVTIELEAIESEPGMMATPPAPPGEPTEGAPPAPVEGAPPAPGATRTLPASCLLTNEEATALAGHDVVAKPEVHSSDSTPDCFYFDPNHTPTSGSPYGISLTIGTAKEFNQNGAEFPAQDIPPFLYGFVNVHNEYRHAAWAYTSGGIEVRMLVTGETWQVPTAEALVLYLRKAMSRYKGK